MAVGLSAELRNYFDTCGVFYLKSGYTPCCLEFLLSEQPDFQAQQNAIQELIFPRGHNCTFLPKYHPELNFIERYWSRVKWYAR